LARGLRFLIDPAHKFQRLIGVDELEIVRHVRRSAAGARTAIDVGASDGYYALYFASQAHIGRVYAFEPDAGLRTHAADNFRINGPELGEKLRLSGAFVGDTPADNEMRLDNLLQDAEFPVVIKIDVDGGETKVLAGATRLLQGGECRLVIETHSADLERACVAMLQEWGYRTLIVPNGWYRRILPERRVIPHNRWLVANNRAR
jgi:FkbM family methyltransferase